MNDLFAIPVLGFLGSLVLTPVVRALALRYGIVDKPDAHRKMHQSSTALCGGLAVLIASLLAVGAAAMLPNAWHADLVARQSELIGTGLAAIVLGIVGVIDDWRCLRGVQKLAGQFVAVCILIYSGFTVQEVSLFGITINLGDLWFPFTCVWLLGAINALNLIDGVDGLATTVGIILCSTLAIMAWWNGFPVETITALAVVGALVGFLYFNFPPATIFLGDAGSMLIGLTAGVLAIKCSLKGPATVALAAPLAVWAIPFFDTSVAILRRKLTGRSIYTTDRGHLHHCLLRRGGSSWRTVSWIATLCLLTSAGALATVTYNNEIYALLTTAGVLGMLVATGIFGHAELLLLTNHVRAAGASFMTRVTPESNVSRMRVHLQGSRNWDQVFDQLRQAAELLDLQSVRLDLNLPMLHEGYHAAWQRTDKRRGDGCWRTVLPIVVRHRPIGRLEITGDRHPDVSVHTWLGQVAELLESVETKVIELAQDVPAKSEANEVATAAADIEASDDMPALGHRRPVGQI